LDEVAQVLSQKAEPGTTTLVQPFRTKRRWAALPDFESSSKPDNSENSTFEILQENDIALKKTCEINDL
jgi:hypothetical protein